MTPKPLHEIRLRFNHQRYAWWWLALLFRKPRLFVKEMSRRHWSRQIAICCRLMGLFLPLQVLICILGRVLLVGVLWLPTGGPATNFFGLILFHGTNLAHGVAYGIWTAFFVVIILAVLFMLCYGVFRLAFRRYRWRASEQGREMGFSVSRMNTRALAAILAKWPSKVLALGLAVAIAFGLEYGTASVVSGNLDRELPGWFAEGVGHKLELSCIWGIERGLAFGVVFGVIPRFWYPRNRRPGDRLLWVAIVLTVASIVTGILTYSPLAGKYGIDVGVITGIVTGITLAIVGTRCYYNVLCFLPIGTYLHKNSYPLHPAAWDDCCLIPFSELDQLLAAYAAQSPARLTRRSSG